MVSHVTGDIIVFIDADGSHKPDDIPKLIKPIVEGEADHVSGSRPKNPEYRCPRFYPKTFFACYFIREIERGIGGGITHKSARFPRNTNAILPISIVEFTFH